MSSASQQQEPPQQQVLQRRPLKIGLIVGSTRPNRIGPEVADWILSIINEHERSLLAASSTTTTTIPRPAVGIIDLQPLQLPIFNEPGIPRHIRDASGYAHAHTRSWSTLISSYDGFLFLSAQRNWGIPAELKNAIDYLYWEWYGKPVGLVCYGGHGGEQVADQLRSVLTAMKVRVLGRQVNMVLPKPEGLEKAFRGERMGLSLVEGKMWNEYMGEIVEVYEALVGTLIARRKVVEVRV